MDTATMLSGLEANGHVELPMAMLGDLLDIDRRAKYGDESGWRGDPTMHVCFNTETHNFEIWALDNREQPYMACSHDKLNLELIRKLVAGDPRKGDVGQRVLDHNAKVRADQEAQERDRFMEFGEKAQWAIRRDMATHFGGRGAVHSIPRKVG